ncbi:MAG: sensor histidine kinase N-terminal domain-containing protein [Hydrogenophaga sp.]|nr:sensor histidine kinase N-terminal domain-containing protein [Hydrogenophaga sp.]
MKPWGSYSLRRQLLLGILLPVLVLVAINTISLYREALMAANTAYDRTLLASAKTISEQLDVRGLDAQARFTARVPYAALEAFEADNQSRMVFKVSTLDGAMVSGYEDLPPWTGKVPLRPTYAALVDFYDDHYRGAPVRVAALVQPVASTQGRGIALIQVAETLELRESLAREILIDTLWRQGLLVLVIGLVVVVVVQTATRPVRALSDQVQNRPANDLTRIDTTGVPRELWPLINATNQLMERLVQLLEHQRRFVRDTSHQLRTPLAVLKVQVQSALRGDQPAVPALHEIEHTVDRATRMANQMLALAKVEQLREQAQAVESRLDQCVREVALDLAPLMAERGIDFDIETAEVTVLAHDWMLNELTRNLLHNAIKHTPAGAPLSVVVDQLPDGAARLTVRNAGSPLAPELLQRLFEPFTAMGGQQGAGLGLAICRGIVEALGGEIRVDNVEPEGDWPGGVQARVVLRPAPARVSV